MKSAFCHIEEIAELLCHYIENKLENGKCEVFLKETCALFTIDVTANVLFGFNPKGLEGNVNELHEALYSTMKVTPRRFLDFARVFLMPWLGKIFKIYFLGEKFSLFATKLMEDIFDQRKKSRKVRNDFVDLLMELRKNKDLKDVELFPQAGGLLFAGKFF